MRYLPPFTFTSLASPTAGRQDKVEIEIAAWTVAGIGEEELQTFYSRIGAPPLLHSQTRRREDHGSTYGWLFNSIDSSEWHWKKTMRVRSEPLEIGDHEGALLNTIPSPLFTDSCLWKARQTDNEAFPIQTTATLDLQLNPTRFARHQPLPRLPHGSAAMYS